MSLVPTEVVVPALRSALASAGYTVAGVTELIGAQAHQALARNETTPAARRTDDGSPLSTLTRLWLLQRTVALDAAARALPGELVDQLCVAGVLSRSVGEVRAMVDVRPYADDDRDWWIASDLTPGLDGRRHRMAPDHVLGVSSASNSLAQLVVRRPVARALDLGTGSGVQAMHLATHAGTVVATDVNARCLELAALTAALNGTDVDLRLGDLYEPVGTELFDLVVSNPPFVISSGTQERLVYRDSGLPGDEIVRRVVLGGAAHLVAGGWCQVLANWVHREEQPWAERVGGWLAETGCDAWVVQREHIDVAHYVEMWLNDAGLHDAADYTARYDAWLGWFAEQRIEAIGFGWLSLRNAGRDVPAVTVEEWPFEIEQPLGPAVTGWAESVDQLDGRSDDDLLGLRARVAPDVVEERLGNPGDQDPTSIVQRQQRGMRRARQVSTAVAAMVGACDGELTLGQISDALATLLDREVREVSEELVRAARSMVLEGFLSLSD